VRGRFLERLQQRVGGRRAEHVDLVDDVHLAQRLAREAEVDALHQVADVVDPVVRRRVELGKVEERALRDRDAVLALAAGLRVGLEIEAVERLREQPRRRGFAGAARAAEQVRMADATFTDRVAQRGDDVLLAHHLAEPLRAVLAVQRLRRHGFDTTARLRRFSRASGHVGRAREHAFPASRRAQRALRPCPLPSRATSSELASSTNRGGPPARHRRPGGTREDPLRAASFRT